MENNFRKQLPTATTIELEDQFVHYLNLAHCSLTHLSERLSEIVDMEYFTGIKEGISETQQIVEKKIDALAGLFTLVVKDNKVEDCKEIVEYLEFTFNKILSLQNNSSWVLKKMHLHFYIQLADAVERSSYTMMKVTASHIGNNAVFKVMDEIRNCCETDITQFLKSIPNKG